MIRLRADNAKSCLITSFSFSAAAPLRSSSKKLFLQRTTTGGRNLSTNTLNLFEVIRSMIVLSSAQVLHQSPAGMMAKHAAKMSTRRKSSGTGARASESSFYSLSSFLHSIIKTRTWISTLDIETRASSAIATLFASKRRLPRPVSMETERRFARSASSETQRRRARATVWSRFRRAARSWCSKIARIASCPVSGMRRTKRTSQNDLCNYFQLHIFSHAGQETRNSLSPYPASFSR